MRASNVLDQFCLVHVFHGCCPDVRAGAIVMQLTCSGTGLVALHMRKPHACPVALNELRKVDATSAESEPAVSPQDLSGDPARVRP